MNLATNVLAAEREVALWREERRVEGNVRVATAARAEPSAAVHAGVRARW